MTEVFLTILKMSLSASVAAFVVMLARQCLRKAPKIYSYILWSTVLFRLLCPFGLTIHLNIPTYSSPVVSKESIILLASCIWLAGTAVMLLSAFLSYIELRKRIGGARRICGNIYEADITDNAFVDGYINTRIIIPKGLDPDQLVELEELDLSGNDILPQYMPGSALYADYVPDDAGDPVPERLTNGEVIVDGSTDIVLFGPGELSALTDSDIDSINSCGSLKEFRLEGADGGDLRVLPMFENMETLRLTGCEETDLSVLTNIGSLRRLELSECGSVHDLSCLAGCKGLRSLTVDDCKGIDDRSIEDISRIVSLEELSLNETDILYTDIITDITPLGRLYSLRSLRLCSVYSTSDISVAAKLSKLEELYLHSVKIHDTSVISSMTGLRRLEISGCRDSDIKDLSFLSGLDELEYLYISEMDVADISPVAELGGLRELILHDLPLSDISPLFDMKLLRRLEIKDCGGTYDHIGELYDALPDCEIVRKDSV